MGVFSSRKAAGVCAVLGALALTQAACAEEAPADAAAACVERSENIDTFKELLVVDEDILTDARAKNATGGAWSFRYAMENMAPVGVTPSKFVGDWLSNWGSTRTLRGAQVDRTGEERDRAMNEALVCPWLKRTDSNGCNDTCSDCRAREFDLAKAPFRLIAIVNRLDLRFEVAGEPSGEGRLVFGTTMGPGDDPASTVMPMSVIAEYRLPDGKSTKQWADAWHALAKFPTTEEPYRAALQEITDGFVKRGTSPNAVNGSSIAQIRTNESAFNWIWQQREFRLDPDGSLLLGALRNTPNETLNGTALLGSFVASKASEIKAKKGFELPPSFQAPSSNAMVFNWSLPGVPEAERREFALQTCNGCHGSEQRGVVDIAFHVSPFKKGRAKLSPMVFNPAGGGDEVTVRVASMRKALCEN